MELNCLRLRGRWRFTHRDARTGLVLAERTYTNVACVNGKNFIASWLNVETPVHTLTNIYGAVGTGATAPAATDTQLQAELVRVVLGTNSRATNAVTFQFFYSTGQANATLAECGCFLGASGTANSGSLLSHCAISEVKTSSVTLTVAFDLTIG